MTFKTLKKIIIITIALNLATAGVAFARETGPDVQTKLEETKESIDELVEAKDQNSAFDISARVKTFKKVIELSISEAKDIKINLIALNLSGNERLNSWRKKTTEKLNEFISYYKEKLNSINEKEDSYTLKQISQEADDFKKWRQENYSPIQTQIHDLFLIKKEEEALQISNQRAEKIKSDLETLEKIEFEDLEKISKMFIEAKSAIKVAEKENKEALGLFIETYTKKATTTSSQSVKSTTTSETATSTEITNPTSTEDINIKTTSTKATSTEINSTSSAQQSTTTDSSENNDEKRSIRGLVGSSWKNIKNAYQIFVEMSGFVRKSL